MSNFTYEEFVTRNIGFVSQSQQDAIQSAKVFVCGVGGMGGACVQALVRSGIGNLAIADFDAFDISNLNRQPFAFVSTNGVDKVDATKRAILDINPTIQLETYDQTWTDQLDQILSKYKVVVNGMDDVRAGILLYRKAREHGAVVVDAYMSPLPSVFVVGPKDPRPEERLRYHTLGLDPMSITDDVMNDCVEKEVVWVMTHSTSVKHIDLDVAAEVVAGKRSRMSFAPMVLATGNLMCFEVMQAIFGGKGADFRGYFFNPWTRKVETPHNPVWGGLKSILVRKFLRKLTHGS